MDASIADKTLAAAPILADFWASSYWELLNLTISWLDELHSIYLLLATNS